MGLGFEQCHDSSTENGYQKVALYEEQVVWKLNAMSMLHWNRDVVLRLMARGNWPLIGEELGSQHLGTCF